MTRGLVTASVVVTAALSFGPVSPGLMGLRSVKSEAPARALDRVAPAAIRVAHDAPAAADAVPATVTVDRPMLTLVMRNPKLESRLSGLLPAGMTVREAAAGFGDQTQFVSTVHVSRSLGIPFAELKTKIVDEQMSLGQAIQALRPTVDVWRELTRVRELTSRDLY